MANKDHVDIIESRYEFLTRIKYLRDKIDSEISDCKKYDLSIAIDEDKIYVISLISDMEKSLKKFKKEVTPDSIQRDEKLENILSK